MEKTENTYLVFRVDSQKFALQVNSVEQVVAASAFTPLPDAPFAIPGLLNVCGGVVPLIDVRQFMGYSERPLELSDRFILTKASGRDIALWVDQVDGVGTFSTEMLEFPSPLLKSSDRWKQKGIDRATVQDQDVILVQNTAVLAELISTLDNEKELAEDG